jgi:hypothetical protein
MANPIERRIVRASELPKRPTGDQKWPPDSRHIPLDDELADTIMAAHHAASVLLGLLESPKPSKHKTAMMKAFAASQVERWGLLASYVHEAYSGNGVSR